MAIYEKIFMVNCHGFLISFDFTDDHISGYSSNCKFEALRNVLSSLGVYLTHSTEPASAKSEIRNLAGGSPTCMPVSPAHLPLPSRHSSGFLQCSGRGYY